MNTLAQTADYTGASRGLGRALARQLAADGWNLIITARNPDALEAVRAELAQHAQVVALAGDVADAEHRAAVAAAVQQLGGVDLLVNDASILGPSPQPALIDYALATLEQVYRVNVLGLLGMIQQLTASFKPAARIINLSSDAGVAAYPGWGGYGSSKAAVELLSGVLAAEQPDWRVYWVDPGDMNTQMYQEAFPGEDVSDRPAPETSVPGLLVLSKGERPSGRYAARELSPATEESSSTNREGGA